MYPINLVYVERRDPLNRTVLSYSCREMGQLRESDRRVLLNTPNRDDGMASFNP